MIADADSLLLPAVAPPRDLMVSRLGFLAAALAVTQSLLVAVVVAGFVIGGVSLWLVHGAVAELADKIDHQDIRIEEIESLVGRIEERWSGGQ